MWSCTHYRDDDDDNQPQMYDVKRIRKEEGIVELCATCCIRLLGSNQITPALEEPFWLYIAWPGNPQSDRSDVFDRLVTHDWDKFVRWERKHQDKYAYAVVRNHVEDVGIVHRRVLLHGGLSHKSQIDVKTLTKLWDRRKSVGQVFVQRHAKTKPIQVRLGVDDEARTLEDFVAYVCQAPYAAYVFVTTQGCNEDVWPIRELADLYFDPASALTWYSHIKTIAASRYDLTYRPKEEWMYKETPRLPKKKKRKI